MATPSTVYHQTICKFNEAIPKLEGCAATEDWDEAKRIAIAFTRYESCFYCLSFRRTLLPLQAAGVCGDCPLQKHGEILAGRPVRHNACYRVPIYRQMVRAAHWLAEEPSRESVKDLASKLQGVKTYLEGIQSEVCANVT